MKRLITLASLLALTTAPSVVFAGGYQWTNNTQTIHGAVVDSKEAAYDIWGELCSKITRTNRLASLETNLLVSLSLWIVSHFRLPIQK